MPTLQSIFTNGEVPIIYGSNTFAELDAIDKTNLPNFAMAVVPGADHPKIYVLAKPPLSSPATWFLANDFSSLPPAIYTSYLPSTDYTTLSSAVSDNDENNIMIIDGVTNTSDVELNNKSLDVTINPFTKMTMNDAAFDLFSNASSNSVKIIINKLASLDVDGSLGVPVFKNNTDKTIVEITGGGELALAGDNYIGFSNPSSRITLKDITIKLSGLDKEHIRLSNAISIIDNTTIVGGGGTAPGAISLGYSNVKNLSLGGDFANNSTLLTFTNNTTLDGLYFNASLNGGKVVVGGNCKNISNLNTSNSDITLQVINDTVLDNLSSVSLDFALTGGGYAQNVTVKNSTINDFAMHVDMSHLRCENVTITGDFVISGNNFEFVNCNFMGTVTVDASAIGSIFNSKSTNPIDFSGNAQIVRLSNDANIGNEIVWEDLPAYTANWSSSAKIGYISQDEVAISGIFTSVIDNNDDIITQIPEKYRPTRVFSRAIIAEKENQSQSRVGGLVTWSGAGTTLRHNVLGVKSTDRVQATLSVMGTQANSIIGAVCGDGYVDFTLENANTSNDAIISFDVMYTDKVIKADLGRDFSLLGSTTVFNNNDLVYTDITYPLN